MSDPSPVTPSSEPGPPSPDGSVGQRVRSRFLELGSAMSGSTRAEVLSGLTVALALVPEAVAFAFLAGVPPLVGLYAAFIICLVTSVLGGRPGMISGATGAMGVVVVALVADHGIGYLFPAVVLCGLLQLTAGLLKLGRVIRIVPLPVMLGFVNGLAIVILMAQFSSFRTLGESGSMELLDGTRLWLMLGLVAATMAIIAFLPRITRAVPSSLAAMIVISLVAIGVNANAGSGAAAGQTEDPVPAAASATTADEPARPVLTVRDMLVDKSRAAAVRDAQRTKDAAVLAASASALPEGITAVRTGRGPVAPLTDQETAMAIASVDVAEVGIAGGLPRPAWWDYELPPFSIETLLIILPFSLILAGVGLIESLMTLTLVDELTETRGWSNRECRGQGIANIICGVLGGMGGCAMIGQSLINVKSGGRRRLSGITAALALLAFILFGAPLIERVPMAALVGVMFMVVIGTFEWTTLQTWRRIPRIEVIVMLVVAAYTVFMHDLATAVLLGVAVSAVAFAWQKSRHLVAESEINADGSKVYVLHGGLFFGSVSSFRDIFTPQDDPDDVVIDFYYSRVYDQSGLEAINGLAERYQRLGKQLHLRHLSQDCQLLLDRAGDLVEVNISEDPHYHVAMERPDEPEMRSAAGGRGPNDARAN